jgi:hypothetical protein
MFGILPFEVVEHVQSVHRAGGGRPEMTQLADRPSTTFEAILLWLHPETAVLGILISGWIRPGDIAYWIFNYMPHWEAASKEARTLLRAFGAHYTTRLFSLNPGATERMVQARHQREQQGGLSGHAGQTEEVD